MNKEKRNNNSDFYKLFLIAILPVFIIGLGLFWLLIDVNSSDEEIKKNILPLEINGRVVDKQIDYKDHATKYVVIKLSNGEQTIFYDSFWYPIYESSTKGDSIYKESGSMRMYVLKKNGIKKEINYRPSNLYFHKKDWNRKE